MSLNSLPRNNTTINHVSLCVNMLYNYITTVMLGAFVKLRRFGVNQILRLEGLAAIGSITLLLALSEQQKAELVRAPPGVWTF